MEYESLIMLGNSSRCTGELELYWDPKASPMLSGEILECDWPLFDVWALLTLGSVEGVFTGNVMGSDVSGNTNGGDGSTWSWDTSWEGMFDGSTLVGGFTGGSLIEDYVAIFELSYAGS